MARTVIRRVLKLVVVAGVVVLVARWFRERDPQIVESEIPGTARWTPLQPVDQSAVPAPSAAASSTSAAPTTAPIAEPTDGAAAAPLSEAWIEPDAGGDCPLSHPVKVKLRSGIYHVPDGLSYERTNADRCYASPEGAEADGYRASKM